MNSPIHELENDRVADNANTVAADLQQTGEQIREAASSAIDSVKDTTANAVQAVSEKIDAGAEKLREAARDVKDGAIAARDRVEAGARDAAADASARLRDAERRTADALESERRTIDARVRDADATAAAVHDDGRSVGLLASVQNAVADAAASVKAAVVGGERQVEGLARDLAADGRLEAERLRDTRIITSAADPVVLAEPDAHTLAGVDASDGLAASGAALTRGAIAAATRDTDRGIQRSGLDVEGCTVRDGTGPLSTNAVAADARALAADASDASGRLADDARGVVNTIGDRIANAAGAIKDAFVRVEQTAEAKAADLQRDAKEALATREELEGRRVVATAIDADRASGRIIASDASRDVHVVAAPLPNAQKDRLHDTMTHGEVAAPISESELTAGSLDATAEVSKAELEEKAQDVKDAVAGKASAAKDAVSDVAADVRDAGAAAFNKAKELEQAAVQGVKDAAGAAADVVATAAHDAKETLAGAGQWIAEAAGSAKDVIAREVQALAKAAPADGVDVNSALDAAGAPLHSLRAHAPIDPPLASVLRAEEPIPASAAPQPAIKADIPPASQQAEKAFEVAGKSSELGPHLEMKDAKVATGFKLERAKDNASEIKDDLKAKGSELKDAASDKLEEAKAKGSELKDAASDKLEEAKAKAVEIKDDLKAKGSELKDAASDKLEEAKAEGSELKDAASDKPLVINEAEVDAQQVSTNAKRVLDSGVKEVKKAAGEVKDAALDAGRQLSAKVDDAAVSVKSGVDKVVDTAKQPLEEVDARLKSVVRTDPASPAISA